MNITAVVITMIICLTLLALCRMGGNNKKGGDKNGKS